MNPIVFRINKYLAKRNYNGETRKLLVGARLEIEHLERYASSVASQLEKMKGNWEVQNITVKRGIELP